MKRSTLIRLTLIAGAFLLLYPLVIHADPEQNPQQAESDAQQNDAEPPEAYVGQMPENEKLNLLAEHKVIATLKEIKYQRCMGETGACPERCGNSGDYAIFEITNYLHYKKHGKYGDDKQEAYYIHITDFHRKPIGDPLLGAYIDTLEAGDLAVIEWRHLYGEVSPGSYRPVRPLLLLKKVDKDQAEHLIEQALADAHEEAEESD